jgi:GAF domain-containing protein
MTAPDADELRNRIGELAQVSLSDETIDAFLHRVADLTVALVPACDASSLSVTNDGRVFTRVSSHEVAQRADEVQYRTGHGPCLEAIERGQPVVSRPLKQEERWEKFTPLAADEGVIGVCSMPLHVKDRTVGAFNLYSLTEAFGPEDQRLAEDFAAQAAVVVSNAGGYYRARELAQHLDEALKSRDIIGQAKGIIMERERLTADQAFDMLRKVSQDKHVKLRDVAELVVLTGTWKDIEPDPS